MKKIYAISGSPRKGWNTDMLLQAFCEGAKELEGVKTELVRLYDLKFRGCISCFGCQLDNDEHFAHCQVRDDIHQLLRDVPLADGLVLGSPIYQHNFTSGLHAFFERLIYQFTDFSGTAPRGRSNAPKELLSATIYTMNVDEETTQRMNYEGTLEKVDYFLEFIFGHAPMERICAYDTLQYKDPSRLRVAKYDADAKRRSRDERFPKDLERARAAGRTMAEALVAE